MSVKNQMMLPINRVMNAAKRQSAHVVVDIDMTDLLRRVQS